ncbi:hypothetical protein M0R45_027977 [Rubus argutus]|uniref:Uncharacterized protein n=1 Tax=Rubus argutus TaxID=59490 RepID=A0AAW1W7Y9_RUBAR
MSSGLLRRCSGEHRGARLGSVICRGSSRELERCGHKEARARWCFGMRSGIVKAHGDDVRVVRMAGDRCCFVVV